MTLELNYAIFGKNADKVQIDMGKLVLAGHSFGACTAINTAHKLSDED